MNKYQLLGIALMVGIIMMICASFKLEQTSIEYATSGVAEFLHFLAMLCITLFGSFAALTLDKLS